MSKQRRSRPKIPPKALRELWEKVPKMVDCKGLCSDSCGPIPVSSLERALLEERTGKTLQPEGAGLTCSLLTNGLCGAYAIRPLVCRIWGAAEGLPCVHGCKPERVISAEEALDLFKQAEEISGDDADQAMREMVESMTPMQRRVWQAKAGPGLAAIVGEILDGRSELSDGG